jgi:ATP-dependent helicase HrpB
VDAVSALLYDELVIQESRGTVPGVQAADELLAQKALEVGVERFVDVEELSGFMGRVGICWFRNAGCPAGAE